MKFAYLDESGKNSDDISVMAGVVVDAYRVHSARREWIKTLKKIQALAGSPIDEFHMKDVYPGRQAWRGVHHSERVAAIRLVLEWLKETRHPVVFSATYKPAFEKRLNSGCTMIQDLEDRWISQAFHLALAIDKEYRILPKNGGKTLLILDRDGGYERKISELIVDPPRWSDTYYGRPKNQDRLGAIIDTTLFADSLHAPLIQVADALAYLLRRWALILDASHKEKFDGELAQLDAWIDIIRPQIQKSSHRYKKIGRCQCAELFWSIAPPSLRSL